MISLAANREASHASDPARDSENYFRRERLARLKGHVMPITTIGTSTSNSSKLPES